jgi:hypothetical protein
MLVVPVTLATHLIPASGSQLTAIFFTSSGHWIPYTFLSTALPSCNGNKSSLKAQREAQQSELQWLPKVVTLGGRAPYLDLCSLLRTSSTANMNLSTSALT